MAQRRACLSSRELCCLSAIQAFEELLQPLVFAVVAGEHTLEVVRGMAVGAADREEVVLDTVLAVRCRELGRGRRVRALDPIEVTLLPQRVHPLAVPLLEVSVRMGDGDQCARGMDGGSNAIHVRVVWEGMRLTDSAEQFRVCVMVSDETPVHKVLAEHAVPHVRIALEPDDVVRAVRPEQLQALLVEHLKEHGAGDAAVKLWEAAGKEAGEGTWAIDYPNKEL